MDSPRIQRIFQASDKNEDGCLDKDEFTELLRTVNPDVGLNDAQLTLIVEEVWTSFPGHVASKGLTLEGMHMIYSEGYADLGRDYDTFIKAHRAPVDDFAIEHVSGGRIGMAAATRQPALADASPLSVKHDIFDALKTPGAPPTAAPLSADDDTDNSLAFALHLPGLASESDLAASGKRQQILAALRDALPEGSSARVASLIPTPTGLAIGIVCSLPPGGVDSEEAEYFQTVMRVEPEQIFPASTFGHAQVLSADIKAAAGAAAAASCAAETAAAVSLAGAPGKVALAFTVRLPEVDSASFSTEKGAKFVAQLQKAMPPGSAARVVHVAPSAKQGVLVTVAASVPASHASQAQALVRKLREDPGAVFDSKMFGPPWVVAAGKPVAHAPGLGVQIRMPDAIAGSSEAQQTAQDLAQQLVRALPEGSNATVRCLEECPSGNSGAVATLVAALPPGTSAAEVERISSSLASGNWIKGSAGECSLVDSALAAGFGPSGDDDELFFGIGSPTERQQRSPSPARALFGRLFGRAAIDPHPTFSLDSPTSPPADAIIAGYQRRPPSSGGSSGLADAVHDMHVNDEEVEGAAAVAALAAADEVSPLKRGDSNASAPVISVVAYTSGAPLNDGDANEAVDVGPLEGQQQEEEVGESQTVDGKEKKKGMWKSLKNALSPSKQRPGVAADGSSAPVDGSSAPVDAVVMAAAAGLVVPVAEEETGKSLTPWELQQRQNAKEWAVIDSHVSQILAQLQYVLDAAANSGSTPDVSSVQHAATMLPPWACHAAHMEIGDKLSQCGMYEEAARSFMEAAAAWPDDPLARFRLGNMHFALNRYQESSRSYFEALKRCADEDPLLVKVHINMGISLESIGRLDAAEREYSKAAVMAPAHPRVHKLVGSARLALGDAMGAVEALSIALEINPDFADAWADLGCAHAALGDVGEAQRCLGEALDIDPNHIEAHYNLGNLLQQCHDLPAAVGHYDAVLALDPDHWRSLLNKAVALARLGGKSREKEAAECLQRAWGELSNLSGALAAEVDALKALMDAGADGEALSQHVNNIEERARRAALRVQAEGSVSASASASASVSMSASLGGGGLSRSASLATPGALADTAASGAPSAPAAAAPAAAAANGATTTSVTHSYGLSPGRIIRSVSNRSISPTKQTRQERASNWAPPAAVLQSDFGEDVRARLSSVGLDPVGVLSTLDVPLLQNLQPCSCVALEDIWAEAKSAEQAMAAANAPQNKRQHQQQFKGMSSQRGLKSKLVPLAYAESILKRLALRHAAPHLETSAANALLGRVLPMLDHTGTGGVDLSLALCIAAALVDCTARERLDLSYRLLMWRTRDLVTGQEDPVTRSQVVELLSTLKMVFERDHQTAYLTSRRSRPTDAQFVLYERFAADVLRFFPCYDVLPVLAGPLS